MKTDEVFNVLRKLNLLKHNSLTLTDRAVDYGYAFDLPKKCKTPYGEYTFDRIYFTPDGIERVIDKICHSNKFNKRVIPLSFYF